MDEIKIKFVYKENHLFLIGCEKLPRQFCAATGCGFEPGDRECHNKTVQSLVDVPEENCDLFPQKTCQVKKILFI